MKHLYVVASSVESQLQFTSTYLHDYIYIYTSASKTIWKWIKKNCASVLA